MRPLLIILVVLSGLTGLSGTVNAACLVQKRTEVPLGSTDGVPTVPLRINGLDATFILDTGAQRSVVTAAAVARLGLRLDEWAGTTMHGVGGIESHRNADTRSMTLGGVPLQRNTLSHDTSLAVGTLPQSQVDGLLGRDYLSVFDLDLDFADKTLTLFSVTDCSGRFLPWSGHYASIPVSNPMGNALVAGVAVDGTPMTALLDTGSSSSMIGAVGMYRLGLTVAQVMRDPGVTVSGQGPRRVVMRRHRFRSMRIDDETIQAPEIWVAPIRFTPIVDMLLGADWMADKRVWISFATRQVFVAPSGP